MCTRSIWKENFQTCLGMNWWIFIHNYQFSSVQSLSGVQLLVTLWTATYQASLSITNSWSLLKLMYINQWCQPTILSSVVPSSCLQSFPASGEDSNESILCIRWPKYWSFSMNPSNEWSALISFKIEWFDLLTVQGTLKSLLQHLKGLSRVFFNTWRDSQVFSPTPQFESINSSAFSLLYGPALTFIHDSWENHSFGYMDLCQQSNVSAF